MKTVLLLAERVIADRGYLEERCEYDNSADSSSDNIFEVFRACHETVNRPIKNFKVIGHQFKHRKELHGFCFHSVANNIQLMIKNGYPLFSIS